MKVALPTLEELQQIVLANTPSARANRAEWKLEAAHFNDLAANAGVDHFVDKAFADQCEIGKKALYRLAAQFLWLGWHLGRGGVRQ